MMIRRKQIRTTLLVVGLLVAGESAAAPLPESFREARPVPVFAKNPTNYCYEPFAGRDVRWTSAADSGAVKLATGCPDFTIDRPRPHGGRVVRAVDFGFSPAHSNNAAAITRAAAYAREIGADRLELAPGVYRCHDPQGVVISGTRDLLIDGKGACLVFYRPSIVRDVPYWQVEISTDFGSFRLLNNERLEIRDLNVDWDWEIDPLAERVRLRDIHLDDRPGASYWEFDFVDYARHPVYPRPLPIQTLTELSEELVDGWRVRFGETGTCRCFCTSEGDHGMKMEWVAPNRARFYPGVRPVAPGSHVLSANEKNFSLDPAHNRARTAAYGLRKGALYRLAHYCIFKRGLGKIQVEMGNWDLAGRVAG